MKVILVNEHLGHTRTYVIRGWLKGVLSLCLLGAPVALGYMGYQLSFHTGVTCDAPVQQSVRGCDTVVDVHRSDDGIAGQSGGRRSGPAQESHNTVLALTSRQGHVLLAQRLEALPVDRPARASYRHGRLIDTATYLRRVYS
ncbi:MAG: hypothetical protein ACQETO_06570 [Pseudomonadota bacterium]